MIWLKEVIADLKLLNSQIDELTSELESSDLYWKPSENKWSIAECLKHLLISNTIYLKDIKKRLETAEVKTIEQPVKFSLTGRIFLLFVDPKYKFKVPAPSIFKPKGANAVSAGDKTLDDFKKLQRLILEIATKACSYDHSHLYTYSPLSRLIRFNVGEQLYIMMRHTKRHVLQAQQVKKELASRSRETLALNN